VEGCKRCDYFIVKTENAELKARLERTVELPCKVGDDIYYLTNSFLNEKGYLKGKVIDLSYRIKVFDDLKVDCSIDYAFPTEIQAEARLKELKGEVKNERD